jgi:hypothetical protein
MERPGGSSMKAKLLLAETAAIHPDGTVSLLRMGITNVWGPAFPVPLEAALVVRVEASMAEAGQHQVEVVGLTADGQPFMPKLDGQFQVPAAGGESNLIIRFSVGFRAYGDYMIAVLIDRTEFDRITLKVKPKPPGETS